MPATAAPALTCPACRSPMTAITLPRRPLGELTLDLCFHCQGIWFDEFESAQMAPAGVLTLFQQLHEQRDALRQPWPESLACPRCEERMVHGLDLCKFGRFSYYRCLQQHGRFASFSAFFMEKGFVRQLNGAEIEALAQKVQTVRCSGCGAPVDIRRDTVCTHCRAPIVVLDTAAVETALQNYHQAAKQQENPDPLARADAILANERNNSVAARERQNTLLDADLGDLLLDGVAQLWQVLRH